jgi:hypothetical protein
MCIGGFKKTYIEQAVGGKWGCGGPNWHNRDVGCYPISSKDMVEEDMMNKVSKGHVVRGRGGGRSFGDHVIGKGGDKKDLATTWLEKEVTQKSFSDHEFWRRGDGRGFLRATS